MGLGGGEKKGAERRGRGGRGREARPHSFSPDSSLRTKILVNHTYPPCCLSYQDLKIKDLRFKGSRGKNKIASNYSKRVGLGSAPKRSRKEAGKIVLAFMPYAPSSLHPHPDHSN